MIHQRILADPTRGDGHDSEGNPGDCFKTCVVNLLNMKYEDVPHFVQYTDWWGKVRRWFRNRGMDAQYFEVDGSPTEQDLDFLRELTRAHLYIASGKSPRGDFQHVVLVDTDLNIVHDPHPSGANLASSITSLILVTDPYTPEPESLLQLT